MVQTALADMNQLLPAEPKEAAEEPAMLLPLLLPASLAA